MKNFYNQISSGAGQRFSYKHSDLNSFEKKIIDKYQKSIYEDLEKLAINLDLNHQDVKILDVGTGRQAIALSRIFPKAKIFHFDMSPLNVARLKNYIIKNKINNIETRVADLDNYNFNAKIKFDLIYLQGVIQHFKTPKKALEKILSKLKLNGEAWLYFYKPGSFLQFNNFAIRKITKKLKYNEFEKFKKYLLEKYSDNKMSDIFLDSILFPHVSYYDYHKIKESFIKSGFEIINTKTCDLSKYDFNHSEKYSAYIFSIKKIRNRKIILKNLKKNNSVNIFKLNYNYKIIYLTIKSYEALLLNFKRKKISKKLLLFNLFEIFRYYYKLNFLNISVHKKHENLIKFLNKKNDKIKFK